jgi:hypothetical protein
LPGPGDVRAWFFDTGPAGFYRAPAAGAPPEKTDRRPKINGVAGVVAIIWSRGRGVLV